MDALKFIKSSSSLPWMCIGDFNEVLHRSEHVGHEKEAMLKLKVFVRWLMFVAFLASDTRVKVGLSRKR